MDSYLLEYILVMGSNIPQFNSRRGSFDGGLRTNFGRFSTRQSYKNDGDEYNYNSKPKPDYYNPLSNIENI